MSEFNATSDVLTTVLHALGVAAFVLAVLAAAWAAVASIERGPAVVRLLRGIARARRRAVERRELLELDARARHDIGLSSLDVAYLAGRRL